MSMHSKSAGRAVLPSFRSAPFTVALAALSLAVGLAPRALSQSASADQKPDPDVLILANGDQLTGKFLHDELTEEALVLAAGAHKQTEQPVPAGQTS